MIIILGMHRSGTSALAGMLHSGGIILGESFMSPLPENPKGFFEDLRIQNINKRILSSVGKDWNDILSREELANVPKSVLRLLPPAYSYFYTNFEKWAWKDPRLCLTFDLWADVLPLETLHVLIVIRHPMSVARSLEKRNNMPLQKGFKLWREYNLRIDDILTTYRLPYTFIQYESIVQEPQRHQVMLESALNVTMGDAWKFIDRKLNRSEIKNSRLPEKVEQTYLNLLKKWGGSQKWPAPVPGGEIEAGENFFVAGRLKEARHCFEKVLETDPRFPEALNNLGVIAHYEKNEEEAISFFRKAVEKDGRFLQGITNLAGSLKNTGDYSAAAQAYSRALQLEENDPVTLNSLAECHHKLGNVKKACEFYQQSLAVNDRQNNVRLLISELSSRAGNRQTDRPPEEAPCSAGDPETNRIPARKIHRIRIVAFSDFETDPVRKLRWGDYWVKLEIQKQFEKQGHVVSDNDPDVILHLFGVPVKNLPQSTHKILWIHSHPDLITPQLLEGYDHIFCLSPSFLKKIREWGFKSDLLIGATSKQPVKRDIVHGITFVGNTKSVPFGRKIIEDLSRTPHMDKLRVWGEGWENILPPENYCGLYYDNQRLGELYASSCIVLNDHHEDMRREGFLAPRVLDVMASGGFVISDDVNGLGEIFGDALVTYRDAEELEHRIEHYLAHPEERDRIIRKGCKIARDFSFENMCATLMSHIDSVLRVSRKREDVLPTGSSDGTDQGYSLLKVGRFEEAEASFRNALSLDAGNFDAVFGLAQVYAESGKDEMAIAALKKCISINPGHVQAENLLKRLLLACMASKPETSIPYGQYTYVHVAGDSDGAFLGTTPATITAFDMISKFNPDLSMLMYSLRKLQDYPWEIIDVLRENKMICFREVDNGGVDISKGSTLVSPSSDSADKKQINTALSLGIPVIGADVPHSENIIQHGFNGLLSKVDRRADMENCTVNLNDLAQNMFFLGRDPELILEMAANAKVSTQGDVENIRTSHSMGGNNT